MGRSLSSQDFLWPHDGIENDGPHQLRALDARQRVGPLQWPVSLPDGTGAERRGRQRDPGIWFCDRGGVEFAASACGYVSHLRQREPEAGPCRADWIGILAGHLYRLGFGPGGRVRRFRRRKRRDDREGPRAAMEHAATYGGGLTESAR